MANGFPWARPFPARAGRWARSVPPATAFSPHVAFRVARLISSARQRH